MDVSAVAAAGAVDEPHLHFLILTGCPRRRPVRQGLETQTSDALLGPCRPR